jgi:hypothetical protein
VRLLGEVGLSAGIVERAEDHVPQRSSHRVGSALGPTFAGVRRASSLLGRHGRYPYLNNIDQHFTVARACALPQRMRLAIELDGDEYHGPERWADDLARQRVMERVGWRFWRCWGSSFRLDPEGCLDDLVWALGSLGIEPMSARETSTVWTEFRTIAPPETVGFDQLVPTPDAVLTPSSSVLSETLAEDAENTVEIGDRVQVQVGEDTRVRVITLTAGRSEPDLGIISVRHPAGAALLGAQEDEEIEFEIDNKPRQWMVIKIEKRQAAARV